MGNKSSAASSLNVIKASTQGRTVLITGANSGLGYATANRFAKLGAKVICATRDDAKGLATVQSIQSATNNPNVTHVAMDLNDLRQVKQAADQILRDHGELHYLINNAGFGMWGPESFKDLDLASEQNIETHFQVNYLSHFYLTNMLLPLMESSVTDQAQSRITNVSSETHHFIRSSEMLNLQVPHSVNEFYSPIKSPGGQVERIDLSHIQELTPEDVNILKYYSTHYSAFAKLAQVMFTVELQNRLTEKGSKLLVNAVHPGGVATNFYKNFGRDSVISMLKFLRFLKSPEQASKYILWAAAEPKLNIEPGTYFSQTRERKPNELVMDEQLRTQLWQLSEQFIEQRGDWHRSQQQATTTPQPEQQDQQPEDQATTTTTSTASSAQ